jgi:hypothetical protein
MSTVVPLRREAIPKRQMPRRRKNAELRTREHLTEREVERSMLAVANPALTSSTRSSVLNP